MPIPVELHPLFMAHFEWGHELLTQQQQWAGRGLDPTVMVFVNPATGKALTHSHLAKLWPQIVLHDVEGVSFGPQTLRSIFVDAVRSGDWQHTPNQQAAAHIMGHSLKMWDQVYDRKFDTRAAAHAVHDMGAFRQELLASDDVGMDPAPSVYPPNHHTTSMYTSSQPTTSSGTTSKSSQGGTSSSGFDTSTTSTTPSMQEYDGGDGTLGGMPGGGGLVPKMHAHMPLAAYADRAPSSPCFPPSISQSFGVESSEWESDTDGETDAGDGDTEGQPHMWRASEEEEAGKDDEWEDGDYEEGGGGR